MTDNRTEVVVIGGGQATPGGAWQHAWDSLRLFSPSAYSSLPGRLMPARTGRTYPDAQHVVEYLADYEKRYELPVERSVRAVRHSGIPAVRQNTVKDLLHHMGAGSDLCRLTVLIRRRWSSPHHPQGH